MKQSVIYKITSPTGRSYVGKTTNISRRLREYGKLRCKSQPALYDSLSKHGMYSHVVELLFDGYATPEALSSLEIYAIESNQSHRKSGGLNLTVGGDGVVGWKASASTRAKMSIRACRHNPMKNPEYLQRMRDAVRSEETRETMSAKAKARGNGPHMKGARNYGARPVIQMSLDGCPIARFETGAQAGSETGLLRRKIYDCCAGRRKTHGGFRWRYDD